MSEDFTGNSFETATTLNLTPNFQTFTSLVNPLDPQDYYSFSLSGKSSFNLSLSGLSANADIELLDRTGKVLQTSAQPGTNLESLFTTLNAGSYYIKVYSGAETTTNYNLSLSATPDQSQNWDALTGFGNPKFDLGVFTVGSSGQVSIDYLFDGGLYQGELGLFSLEGMDTFLPSSDAFFQEAARRALSNSQLGHVAISEPRERARFHASFSWEGDNAGEYQGVKTFSMRPGDEFGVMLVPNGRVQQVFDNPAIGGEVRPLFSLSTANPNDAFHVGQIADITGDGSTFVMEDLRVDYSSDKDYNDVIFQVRGAKGTAVSLDRVIDPTHDWRLSELGQQLLDYAKSQNQPPEIVNPVKDLVLTLEHPTQIIDLSQVFQDKEGEALRYEIVAGNSNSLSLKLDSNQLQLTSLPQAGITPIAIRAIDEAGNAVTHSWTVTTSTLSNESVQQLNAAVSELHQAIHQEAGGDLITGLSSATGEEAIAKAETFLAQNPQITPLLTQPDSLSQLGISSEKVTTVNQLLQSPELAAQLGLSVPLQEALNQPDTGLLDPSQIDANDAIYLIPSDAPQPKVGIIDLTETQHLEHVTQTFASVNPLASYDTLPVTRGNWASQLVQFVDRLKASGETKGIVNLSFDLSQLDEIGQTTRYELTPEEQQALQYARENNVLLIVAAGNTGGRMSALGAASQQYDNIITVGATNRWEQRANYSAYGQELSLMAPGGEWQNNPNAFVGTSKSTAYVTAAASLVWAANPGLSYQQVKQLLLETAVDLDAPGWDALTGAGLLAVSEAIRRALLTEPNSPLSPSASLPLTPFTPFSGEGRVQTLVRPTSDGTEKAITQLQDTQQTLFDQWQVLSELGNSSFTLSDLESEVGQKTTTAFNTYQQVSTQAAITTAQEQQWTEALTLATNHYQIEQARLQALEARKKELEEKLAGLGQEKTALEAETQQLLTDIQKQIDQAEKDLATAQAKLLNPFANFSESLTTLPKDPEGLRKAASEQWQLVQFYQQQAKEFEVEKERYAALAKSYEANSWRQQIIGYQPTVSGKQKALLDWIQDPQKLKLRDGNLWQAEIAEQNRLAVEHLAQQTEQQATALIQYAQFLESNTNSLDLGDANINDVENVLKFLQEQAAEQEALAQNYWKEVSIAEQRRQDNQAKADWHNAESRKWQVVGTKRKRSGKREDVWGWAYYPEHIPPRDQAQQLANQALQERQVYEQWAQQAQQHADILKAQAEKLRTSIKDWPVLKLGIDYEITADRWRLQAEQDLLALHTPDQQQKLETINLTIAQTEAELQTLQSEKLPAQTAVTNATKNRLEATEAELLAIQEQRTTALHDLQNFLETAGFLLPYKERLTAIAKQIQQLEADKLQVQTAIQQLIQTPNDTLRQQLNDWNGYLETLQQQLQYAQLQQDQLALAVADSPERLAITALIQELEKPETPNNLKSKIQNLKSFEGSGANFLQGFDNLSERLTQVKAEQATTAEALTTLQQDYRNLGLAKADLEINQIPAQQQQIAAIQNAIAQSETTLTTLQSQLPQLQASQAQKAAGVEQQKQAIATTQFQLTDIQNQIAAKDSEIQQQQSVLQGYQNQISQTYAVAEQFEQQRLQHQAAADYWNAQIPQPVKSKLRIVINPLFAQIVANRDAEQTAANTAQQQRDNAIQQTQVLIATLQPQIAATQQYILTREQEKQPLLQQQQAVQSQREQQLSHQQQLQQELQAITQQVNAVAAEILTTGQKLDGLNKELQASLTTGLAKLNQQKAVLEQQLIDKYREIELTEQYLQQVNDEVNRLQSRLDLLNRAGILEQKYQDGWNNWQQATQAQATATEALIATRQAGTPDREQLASLQSELAQVQGILDKARSLTSSLADAQKNLELTNLQLGNQRLLLQSLIDQDAPLATAEADAYNKALAHQGKIWYWNGQQWAENPTEAQQARYYIEQASFLADRRNKLWQSRQLTDKRIKELEQQASEQQSQINHKQAELAALGATTPQLEAQVSALQAAINTIVQRLEPLQKQENSLIQAFQTAVTKVQNLASEIVKTTQQQAIAAQQLISFGILASESDVDFFATQVQPKVENLLSEMQKRGEDLTKQLEQLTQQIAGWEQELAKTTDEVSKNTLTDLIKQSKAQLKQLETWKTENQTATEELDKLLKQAIAALEPLRQKQELEIRQKLESNDTRLDALESQLRAENAADNLAKTGTVLAAAELTDQINQDLRDSAINWTQQLQEGHQKTKQSGETQQKLSQSVDELISYIQDNFAEPQGQYNRTKANLRDDITSLGVVENRADEYDLSVTSTEQAVERIKLRIAQDAALWQEIAPIATHYGVESQELQEYQKQYQAIVAAKSPKLAQVQALRDRAASIDQQAQAEYNRYQTLNKQIADQLQLLNSYPQWMKGLYSRLLQPQIDRLQQQAQAVNTQYQTLNNQVVNLRQQADALQKQADTEADATTKLLRKQFIEQHPENSTAIALLQGETLEGSNPSQQISDLLSKTSADDLLQADAVEGRSPNQQLLDKAKAAQAEHEAQGNAAIVQADWYEREAAAAWERSRKSGPTWSEERCTRGRSGKRRCEWITHVDYDWILWDNYRQLVPQLRQKGAEELAEADKWRKGKERLEPLAKQWSETNEAANQAEPPIKEAQNFVEELKAKRESIPNDKIQQQVLEDLLSTLKQQLEQARQEAQARNAKVQQEWANYDSDAQDYRQAVAAVLQRRGELNLQAIEAQQQLAENERWVERQSVALGTELESTKLLATNLQQQRQEIDNQIRELVKQGITVEGLDDLYSKGAQLDRSLQLVTNKAAVLTAQQTALTQKRTLLTAQNEVILAEQRLLDAYIKDPNADFSTLQQQLQDARAALAVAQRLAEQAQAASNALSAPLQQLQTDLLAQNDEHLKAAKEQQRILKALLEKTQLNANYTLQAAQKQREVNDLEFQILTRLQQATDAGSQEAKYLLDVAHHNGVATAAEIYYRDYSDLASDKGGGCTKGVARPEDRVLADQYYRQMLEQRELQRRAQEQASYFGQIKDTAQAQIKTLQKEQEDAAKLLSDLNNKIAATQEEMATKQQELSVVQARLDGITRIREQTEQTFIQLVTLEQLNLAQAQLEQEIAQQRQAEIEQAVKDRMERDRLELERQRKETTAKIEQLRQLQAEDNLRQAVNGVRGQLGMTTLDPTEDPVQLQSQLAGLLSNLKDLESQQLDLPADVKALLAEARKDINLALQGKEASTIQTNLLNAMGGLIGQIEQYKAEINRIDLEEQLDSQLLQTAQQNLQTASQDLLKELERSKVLGDEHDVIDPLYLEALTKAAYAQQAVDITNELGQQAKEALEQIIKQRIEQRKLRKKMFWMKLLGIISTVIGIMATIATIGGFAPLAIGLTAASAGISAIQAAINGDWIGAIFSVVMAGVNVVTAGMGNAISATTTKIIEGLKAVATGAFNGARSIMSGESILGALQILGGFVEAVIPGLKELIGKCAPAIQKVMVSIIESLQKAPELIYKGVKSIQTGDWFAAISNIFNAVLAIGKSFASNFNKAVENILKKVDNLGNTGLILAGGIKDGWIESWLSGINGILDIWKDDLKELVDNIKEKDKSYPQEWESVFDENEEPLLSKSIENFLNNHEWKLSSLDEVLMANIFSDRSVLYGSVIYDFGNPSWSELQAIRNSNKFHQSFLNEFGEQPQDTTWEYYQKYKEDGAKQMIIDYKNFIIKVANNYGVDPRAIAGAIRYEYEINVISRKGDESNYKEIQKRGSFKDAIPLDIHLGSMLDINGVGWGKLHYDLVRDYSFTEPLTDKNLSDRQVATLMASAPTAIDLIAREMSRDVKAYRKYAGEEVDISHKPEILVSVYNLGLRRTPKDPDPVGRPKDLGAARELGRRLGVKEEYLKQPEPQRGNLSSRPGMLTMGQFYLDNKKYFDNLFRKK